MSSVLSSTSGFPRRSPSNPWDVNFDSELLKRYRAITQPFEVPFDAMALRASAEWRNAGPRKIIDLIFIAKIFF